MEEQPTKLSVKSTIETYQTLVELLRKEKKLYFLRYGDGEFVSMMGHDHRNYNFSPEMQQELIECFSIEDPQFLIASVINIQNEKGMSRGLFARFGMNNSLEEYVLENQLQNQTGVYESPVMFHYLSVFKPKLIYQFFEEFVRPEKKMFIGSTPQQTAEKLYGPIDIYVPVPAKHAYDSIDNWWSEIEKQVDAVSLVIVSAGAASKVIGKRLWYLDKEIHLLDVGSLVDAVEMNVTRTWIRLKGHKINKVLPKEHREKRLSKRILFLLKDIKYFFRLLISK